VNQRRGIATIVAAAALSAVALAAAGSSTSAAAGQSDLDAFMKQVLARRDDNWKKLQQYILDEREEMELRGPARIRLWGERREYTWYVRDGFFVRSPLKFNGVEIGESDRRKYEDDYLRRVQRRDGRGESRTAAAPAAEADTAPMETPTDVAGLIRQSRQPEFISSSYFLRFRFDAGTYAFVGRERLEDREVLRIEYYPTRLFNERRERQGRDGREGREGQEERERRERGNEVTRLMNKVALVTLWIEPASHQIVKFTYDNVSFDFLPAQWLVSVEDVRASMTMSQPFPDVWLPLAMEVTASLALALGPVDFRYALAYSNYRQATAEIRIR
jgi:hypothetical protein